MSDEQFTQIQYTMTNTNNNVYSHEKRFTVEDGIFNSIFNRFFLLCNYGEQYNVMKMENITMSHNKEKLMQQITDLIAKLEESEDNNAILKDDLKISSNLVLRLQNDLRNIPVTTLNSTKRLKTMDEPIENDKLTINQYEQQILMLESQVESVQTENEQLQDKIEGYLQNYTNSSERILQIDQELNYCKGQLLDAEARLKNLNILMQASSEESDEHFTKLNEYQKLLKLSEQQVNNLTAVITKLNEGHATTLHEVDGNHKTVEKLEQQIDILQEQLAVSEDAVQKHYKNLVDYKSIHSFNNVQYHDIESVCHELQNSCTEVEAKKNSVTRSLMAVSMNNDMLCKEVDYLLDQHTTCCTLLHREETYERC